MRMTEFDPLFIREGGEEKVGENRGTRSEPDVVGTRNEILSIQSTRGNKKRILADPRFLREVERWHFDGIKASQRKQSVSSKESKENLGMR